MTGAQTNASRIRELNATIRYAMWSVFRVAGRLGPAPVEDVAAEVEALLEQLAAKDVAVRGIYDMSALRADADVMVWWHAPSADALQEAYGMWRRTALSDYEWILAFEADELLRIVDLMRDLRGSGARRHVREEVPFFTGRRRSISEILATLP